jgi:hypothetical protein
MFEFVVDGGLLLTGCVCFVAVVVVVAVVAVVCFLHVSFTLCFLAGQLTTECPHVALHPFGLLLIC